MIEAFDYFDIGRRNNPVIDWLPVGNYIEASVEWKFGIDPGQFAFELAPSHPLNEAIAKTGIRKTAYHFRCARNGRQFTGRIHRRHIYGPPGRERYVYSGYDYKYWMQRMYCWVNNLFPPEIQIGLTGKQNVKWGTPDMVFKHYNSEVATRLNKPIYSALPFRVSSDLTYTNLSEIANLDGLLELAQNGIVKQARFTQHDELFKQEVVRLEMGIDIDLWDGRGTKPVVFNTNTLGKLQSIINYTSDNFLDLSLLANVGNGLWSNTPDRACYVFNTRDKRDNRKVHFRTDAEYGITEYDYEEVHADATRAIVGGKSPTVVNSLIEIGANLAIQLLINLIAPGLGLGVVVGDLFDDIFFAYQVFYDNDLENEIGDDDAFSEVFADNTAAWSLDGYTVGQTALKEHSGSEALTITAASGVPGKGNSFGADDGTARRFREGDTVTLWDRGNTVEQYVSSVIVTDKRDGHSREQVTLGDDKRLTGTFDRLLDGITRGAAGLRGIANST